MENDSFQQTGHELGLQDDQELRARNPGYSQCSRKGQVLRKDSIELAVDVHLALAGTAVRAAAMDVDAASRGWNEAIRLAGAIGSSEPTQ